MNGACRPPTYPAAVAAADDVREICLSFPRAYEREVGGLPKFRVGNYVVALLSGDESLLGFAFPREEREGLVASEPDKFLMPIPSNMKYNWVRHRRAERQTGRGVVRESTA